MACICLIGEPSLQQLLGNVGDVPKHLYNEALRIGAVYLKLVLMLKREEQQQQLQQQHDSNHRSSNRRTIRCRLARQRLTRQRTQTRNYDANSDADDDGDAGADTEAAHALRRTQSRTRRVRMMIDASDASRTTRVEATSCAREADLVGVARERGISGCMQQQAQRAGEVAEPLLLAFSMASSDEGTTDWIAARNGGQRREVTDARTPCHDAADEDTHAGVLGLDAAARMVSNVMKNETIITR